MYVQESVGKVFVPLISPQWLNIFLQFKLQLKHPSSPLRFLPQKVREVKVQCPWSDNLPP